MIPDQMRVARIYDYGDIRIETHPVPDIGPDDALVKMAACGICTSDTLPWYIRRKAPIVLGHEPAGTIVAVGSEVEGFVPGDRVFTHHHAPCLVCRRCQRGLYSTCPTWKASSLDPGGLAEYARIPSLNLRTDTLHLPDHVTFEDGVLVEPTACVVQALRRRARMRQGDHVLIIGMGIMGQMLALVARHYGAETVIVADRVPYRLAKALDLGADVAVDVTRENLRDAVASATHGDLADLVVVGPGSTEAMESGLDNLGVGGVLLLFTPTPEGESLPISPYDLYFKDQSIVTSYSCAPPDTREAMDIVASGVVTSQKLVTHRFPLDQAGEGFRTVAAAEESIKTIILMDPDQT
jgi:L-iditol 2-dehydrogenase